MSQQEGTDQCSLGQNTVPMMSCLFVVRTKLQAGLQGLFFPSSASSQGKSNWPAIIYRECQSSSASSLNKNSPLGSALRRLDPNTQ